MDRVVIVGGGLAGHRAAAALRAEAFTGEVVLVGDEVHAPYDRPPLSKQLLAGAVEPADCRYASADGGAPVTRLGVPATGLDVAAHEVALADGERLAYDGLVIATGRRARSWPGMGALGGVHTLRSLDDAVALRGAVADAPRVAIVGAGFIGCEVAATLRAVGVEHITLIDVAPHPMPALGAAVGERAAALQERNGVRLRLGAPIAGFEGDERVRGVRLAGGDVVEAEVVLVALGAVPNTGWLGGSGLELRGGAVLCDEHCFAEGTQDVVAAGDVAAWPHPLADAEPVSIEHWAIARDMGALAARNLLAAPGDRRPFATVPTFWSDQYDVKIKSAGLLARADRFTVVEEDRERSSLVVEAHRGDELVAAVVFNRNKKIIEYQRALAARLDQRVAA